MHKKTIAQLPEAPQPAPHYELLKISDSFRIPSLLQEVALKNGVLSRTQGQTTFSVELVAIKNESEVTAQKIRNPIHPEFIEEGTHTQLMGDMPFVVLGDKTQYAIRISLPAASIGQEVKLDEVVGDGFLQPRVRYIGTKKKSYCAVIRVDDNIPLLTRKLTTTSYVSDAREAYGEMLWGLARGTQNEDTISRIIDKKCTVIPQEGRDTKLASKEDTLEANLVFDIPEAGTIEGSRKDQKGQIEVLIMETTDMHITEKITLPAEQAHFMFSMRSLSLGSGTKGIGGGFQAGQTTFGEEKKETANISSTKIDHLVAAFKMVLVGEKKEVEMTPNVENIYDKGMLFLNDFSLIVAESTMWEENKQDIRQRFLAAIQVEDYVNCSQLIALAMKMDAERARFLIEPLAENRITKINALCDHGELSKELVNQLLF